MLVSFLKDGPLSVRRAAVIAIDVSRGVNSFFTGVIHKVWVKLYLTGRRAAGCAPPPRKPPAADNQAAGGKITEQVKANASAAKLVAELVAE